jgi:branched-subunit amino acid aminotransferase/4-amino-4-deoxychorismate lyase
MDTARAPSETRTFALLETMRLEDGRLRRIERHLARAAAAARDFGHAWDEATSIPA